MALRAGLLLMKKDMGTIHLAFWARNMRSTTTGKSSTGRQKAEVQTGKANMQDLKTGPVPFLWFMDIHSHIFNLVEMLLCTNMVNFLKMGQLSWQVSHKWKSKPLSVLLMVEHDGLDSDCTHFAVAYEIIFLALGNTLKMPWNWPKSPRKNSETHRKCLGSAFVAPGNGPNPSFWSPSKAAQIQGNPQTIEHETSLQILWVVEPPIVYTSWILFEDSFTNFSDMLFW